MTQSRLIRHHDQNGPGAFLPGPAISLDLARETDATGCGLAGAARACRTEHILHPAAGLTAGRPLAAMDHPGPARVTLADPGPTPLGSGERRVALLETAVSAGSAVRVRAL